MAVEYDANGTPILTNDSLISDVPPYTQALAAANIMPVGAIMPYMGETAPNYWLLCDGSQYDPDKLPELYAVNNDFHAPDNYVGEFRVPDLRGRAPVGPSDDDNVRPNPDNRDNAVKARGIGKRFGYWTLADHTHLAPTKAAAGDTGLGVDTQTFWWDGTNYGFTTHWYHRVNDAPQLTKDGIQEPQDPATVVNFIVYAGRPTAGISPISVMPGVTATTVFRERLEEPDISEEEVKMLKEQLAELKEQDAK